MESTVHHQVLAAVFAIGAVANKTGFCTMGAVSDWINIGDTGRMRSWLLAMAIAGVLSMGCTIGQAITGVSTLALGSLLTFVAIVVGAAATMKY